MSGTRYGDSRIARAPTFGFSTAPRPPVGTSQTYQGAEFARANDSPIGGLSPGPKYLPLPGKRVGPSAPAYSIGGVGVELDKRVSPGPCNYGFAQARSIGPQKIDSMRESLPSWGMGGCTREVRNTMHLANYHASNISSRTLLGGTFDDAVARGVIAAPAAPPPVVEDPTASRSNLTRALAVAMAASKAESDPELAAALTALHKRVGTLKAASSVAAS